MTGWLNSFGTVLTPMMPVGLIASIASTKDPTGAWRGRTASGIRRDRCGSVVDQAVDVEEPIASARLFDRAGLRRHGLADQFGDAGRRRAAAEKQEALVGQLLPEDAQRGENAGDRDGGGALDVVVIGADPVAVTRQDRHGVEVREVLPLDAAFREELPAPPSTNSSMKASYSAPRTRCWRRPR